MITDRLDEGVSRRKVLQSIGTSGMVAAGFGMASFSTTAKKSDPQISSPVIDTERINGSEMSSEIQSVVNDTNTSNVMGSSWVDDVKQGKVKNETQKVPANSSENGSSEEERKEISLNKVESNREDSYTIAAKHELDNGNKLIVVGFTIGDDQLIVYRSFERPQDQRKSKVTLYEVLENKEGDYPKISQIKQSVNGAEPKEVSEVDTSNITKSSECDDPCGGCHGAPPGSNDHGKFTDASCRESIDLECVGHSCSTCLFGCTSGPAICAVCIVVMCSFWSFVRCCPDDPEKQCLDCNTGADGYCNEV